MTTARRLGYPRRVSGWHAADTATEKDRARQRSDCVKRDPPPPAHTEMLGGRRCCGNLVSIGDAADAPGRPVLLRGGQLL